MAWMREKKHGATNTGRGAGECGRRLLHDVYPCRIRIRAAVAWLKESPEKNLPIEFLSSTISNKSENK